MTTAVPNLNMAAQAQSMQTAALQQRLLQQGMNMPKPNYPPSNPYAGLQQQFQPRGT